ncbi:MAG TPA: ATP-binding cassette domain-containing protein, partial [Armatimonadota bacterium]|nr:ATP-binding cassette domain-containing protein [Armatimonadota bacterium]
MIAPSDIKIDVRDLTVYYGQDAVIENLSLTVMRNEILGIIGPANSGKSTFLRVLNRTLELTANTRATGRVLLDGEDTLS